MIAVRAGGPGSATNGGLRTAIERARAEGLPKENIERAVARASKAGGATGLQEFLCEATAAGGVSLLIEGITDNKNRSIGEIKHILSEHGARLADPGSLAWNFEKLGILEIEKNDNSKMTDSDIELAIIDAGAKDLARLDDSWVVETDFVSRDQARHILEGRGVVIHESGHDYKPRSTQASEGHIETLLSNLLQHEDVQEVYTNLSNHEV